MCSISSLALKKRSALKNILFNIQFGKLTEYGKDDAYIRRGIHFQVGNSVFF